MFVRVLRLSILYSDKLRVIITGTDLFKNGLGTPRVVIRFRCHAVVLSLHIVTFRVKNFCPTVLNFYLLLLL